MASSLLSLTHGTILIFFSISLTFLSPSLSHSHTHILTLSLFLSHIQIHTLIKHTYTLFLSLSLSHSSVPLRMIQRQVHPTPLSPITLNGDQVIGIRAGGLHQEESALKFNSFTSVKLDVGMREREREKERGRILFDIQIFKRKT